MSEDVKRIFGIDLGTTFSAIAYINDDGKPEIIPNADGEPTTPSVVFFESANNVIVGSVAKESAKTDPANVIEFVKREIGSNWTFDFEGTQYTPQKISSLILKRLAHDAGQALRCKVEDVVITCPAYFGSEHRNATEEAGRLAGLNVIQILDEPAAAALCYAFEYGQDKKDKTILVYDLGGGTFDVTVLSIKNGTNITVVCTDGDHRLGGVDWDKQIIDYFADKFQQETGCEDNILDDPDTAYDLRLTAENGKKALSKRDSTTTSVAHGGDKVKISLTKTDFDSMTKSLLEQTYSLIDKVINLAKNRGVTTFDEILLVGSSTLMPQVSEGIKARYGNPLGIPVNSYQPGAAVASGAAIFAFMRYTQNMVDLEIKKMVDSGTTGADIEKAKEDANKKVARTLGLPAAKVEAIAKTEVTLCATKSYGIEVQTEKGSQVSTMIVRQTPLPCKSSATFGLTVDNQTEVMIKVYSHDIIPEIDEPDKPDEPNNRKTIELKYCNSLGENVLSIPAGKKANDPIEVTFEVDNKTGMLNVTAREPDSGRTIDCHFEVKGAMSEEEMEVAQKQINALKIE